MLLFYLSHNAPKKGYLDHHSFKTFFLFSQFIGKTLFPILISVTCLQLKFYWLFKDIVSFFFPTSGMWNGVCVCVIVYVFACAICQLPCKTKTNHWGPHSFLRLIYALSIQFSYKIKWFNRTIHRDWISLSLPQISF